MLHSLLLYCSTYFEFVVSFMSQYFNLCSAKFYWSVFEVANILEIEIRYLLKNCLFLELYKLLDLIVYLFDEY